MDHSKILQRSQRRIVSKSLRDQTIGDKSGLYGSKSK